MDPTQFILLLKQIPGIPLKILKCHLFEKSGKSKSNNGDEFLKLIRFNSPKNVNIGILHVHGNP